MSAVYFCLRCIKMFQFIYILASKVDPKKSLLFNFDKPFPVHHVLENYSFCLVWLDFPFDGRLV